MAPSLLDIARIIDYLHSKESYMHGDIKPKNNVRERKSGSCRLVYFDDATPFGTKMGAKVSSAQYVRRQKLLTWVMAKCPC